MDAHPRKIDARQSQTFRGAHRLRVGRKSQEGACYFITTKTHEREPLFLQPAAAGIVMRSIEWMQSEGRWEWLCYVVMPDHLHLVFALTSQTPLKSLLRSFKGFTADRINETLRRQGTLWQDGYFDHRIRSHEKLDQVAFYCFRNPVHARLVLDGRDWPFFKCQPALWAEVEANYDYLLALEADKKGWEPPAVRAD